FLGELTYRAEVGPRADPLRHVPRGVLRALGVDQRGYAVGGAVRLVHPTDRRGDLEVGQRRLGLLVVAGIGDLALRQSLEERLLRGVRHAEDAAQRGRGGDREQGRPVDRRGGVFRRGGLARQDREDRQH